MCDDFRYRILITPVGLDVIWLVSDESLDWWKTLGVFIEMDFDSREAAQAFADNIVRAVKMQGALGKLVSLHEAGKLGK
jgi:hypothetical protein